MDFEITDTDRINHLQRIRQTKWVGYDISPTQTVSWPIFAGQDVRKEMVIIYLTKQTPLVIVFSGSREQRRKTMKTVYELDGTKCFPSDITPRNGKEMVRVFQLSTGPIGGLFCGESLGVYERDDFYRRAKRREDLDEQVC